MIIASIAKSFRKSGFYLVFVTTYRRLLRVKYCEKSKYLKPGANTATDSLVNIKLNTKRAINQIPNGF